MKTGILLMMVLGGIIWCSCDDITKGYLETESAEYLVDTLRIRSDPDSKDSIPYQSQEIQGIIGTFPIYYGIEAVRDQTGQKVADGIASQVRVVLKGMIQIEKNHTIPVGTYTIDLRVWNLGRSFVCRGIYTVVVDEAER